MPAISIIFVHIFQLWLNSEKNNRHKKKQSIFAGMSKGRHKISCKKLQQIKAITLTMK
jgi:hypothetical protein